MPVFATVVPFGALGGFCDPGNNSLGKSTGREMGWQGCVSEKDLASGSGIVGESAEKREEKKGIKHKPQPEVYQD